MSQEEEMGWTPEFPLHPFVDMNYVVIHAVVNADGTYKDGVKYTPFKQFRNALEYAKGLEASSAWRILGHEWSYVKNND